MKLLKSSLAAKIAAVVLLTVSAVFAIGSGLGLIYAYNTGILTKNKTFWESDICRSDSYYLAHQIAHAYQDGESAEDLKADFSGENSGTDFKLTQEGSGIIADTIDPLQTYEFQETYSIEVDYWIPLDNGEDDQRMSAYYTVACAVKNPIPQGDTVFYRDYWLFQTVVAAEPYFVPVLIVSLVILLICLIFLLCATGHKAGVEGIHLNWQDRIPLDLYLFAAGCAVAFLLINATDNCFYYLDLFLNILGCIAVVISGLLVLAALLTISTRLKAGKWWRNTLICRLLKRLRGAGGKLWGILHLLPMFWRTAIIVCAILLVELFLGVQVYYSDFALLLLFLFDAALVAAACWWALQQRMLQKAGEQLAAGNLNFQTDTSKMYWDYKRHAENLNSIADGMTAAVNQKMKSERLKTELITNVSHDIKTPLTSIVNYVDLLQTAGTEEERKQYLDVLTRQSARLKKLIEDLVEASKASTGNLTAKLCPTNLTEILNQALGEYESRLEQGNLELVTDLDAVVSVLADGKLLWRVLDNLLNNVCKYSMSGTRVYVTAQLESAQTALITVKNISRQQLNISAEELMERFVRGDASRSTEGSGLGLNIARSLTELQQGSLKIRIDGDLFRVELRMPVS